MKIQTGCEESVDTSVLVLYQTYFIGTVRADRCDLTSWQTMTTRSCECEATEEKLVPCNDSQVWVKPREDEEWGKFVFGHGNVNKGWMCIMLRCRIFHHILFIIWLICHWNQDDVTVLYAYLQRKYLNSKPTCSFQQGITLKTARCLQKCTVFLPCWITDIKSDTDTNRPSA